MKEETWKFLLSKSEINWNNFQIYEVKFSKFPNHWIIISKLWILIYLQNFKGFNVGVVNFKNELYKD